MASSSHKSLVRVLLWWVTVLSISQVVLLVLLFTVGPLKQPQTEAEQGSPVPTAGHRGHQSSSELGVSSDKARMFTFKVTGVHSNHSITLYAVDSKDLPTDEGQMGVVNIKKDGYFFMCLQITLGTSDSGEDRGTEGDSVSLLNQDNESILFGLINNKTRSTGLLCKMERLTTGSVLRVDIQTKAPGPSRAGIDDSRSFLDIIYMPS